MPVLSCLLILYFQYLANVFSNIPWPTPIDEELTPLNKCRWENCVTVGYGIVGKSKDVNSEEYEWI